MPITSVPRFRVAPSAVAFVATVLLIAAAVSPSGQSPAYSGAEWSAPGGDWASHALLDARRDQHDERQSAEGRLGRRAARSAGVEGAADDEGRTAVRAHESGHHPGARSRHRPDPLDLQASHSVQRQPRRGNRRRIAVCRPAQFQRHRCQSGHRHGRVDLRARPGDSVAGNEHRARLWQRRRRRRGVARRQLPARPRDRTGGQDRQVPLDLRSGARTWRDEATRHGRKAATYGSTGAGPSGPRRQSMRSSGSCISKPATPSPSGAANTDLATISSTTPSLRST